MHGLPHSGVLKPGGELRQATIVDEEKSMPLTNPVLIRRL